MEFKDFFSVQSEQYSRYRPTYPAELFKFLSSICASHQTALDTATGNGQAAIGLAPLFSKIIAIDASVNQLKYAFKNEKIEYRNAAAEDTGLDDKSIDLVTMASAFHWIDKDRFFAEANRIIKPGGILAVWRYDRAIITKEIDDVVYDFSDKILSITFPADTRKLWKDKNTISLPFEPVKCPEFTIELDWTLDHFMNYAYTWGATQNYVKTTGTDPLPDFRDALLPLWGTDVKHITLPIELKAARV